MPNGERVSFKGFFSLFFLKKLFSMESSRTLSGAIQRNHIHSQESDPLLRSPRAGANPIEREAAAPGVAKVWASHWLRGQPNTLSLCSGRCVGQREVTTGQWAKMKMHLRSLASRNDGRLCCSQGPWPVSVSWGDQPGVAKAVVCHTRSSQQLRTPRHGVICLLN